MKIKRLEWSGDDPLTAETDIGTYEVLRCVGYDMWVASLYPAYRGEMESVDAVFSADEAKAACQRHFEETVMACLEGSSSDDSSVAALALRAMQATEDDNCEDIWWRADGEYAPLTIFASCNDLFYWACSDHEKVTQENIHVFEQAYKDSPKNGAILFCCRMRGMRPQGAYYKYIEPSEKHLFDACGPLREADKLAFGNPHDQSEYDSDQAT